MASKWGSVLGVIGKLAPTIASAVGGPLAGSAVSALEGALGVSATGSDLVARQDSVASAIASATPEQLLAIKTADNNFAVKMAELGFDNSKDLEQLAVSDRADARKREEETKDYTPRILGFSVTAGFFLLLALMSFRPIPAESKDMVNIMLGSLATAWVSVVSYYFGSSSGESHKTELLAKAPAVETRK